MDPFLSAEGRLHRGRLPGILGAEGRAQAAREARSGACCRREPAYAEEHAGSEDRGHRKREVQK